jgi:ABC-type transporter Mla MlaB component
MSEFLPCDVRAVEPDAAIVDALARLQLIAQRRELELRLQNVPPELVELIEFMGLGDVLVVESRWETE